MGGMSALSRASFVGLCGALTTSIFLPNAADKRLWVLMALMVAIASVSQRVAVRESTRASWANDVSGPGVPRIALAPGRP